MYRKVYFIGGRVIKMGIACLSYLSLFRAFSVRLFFSFCCSVWWWWRVEEDRKGGDGKSIDIPCFAFFQSCLDQVPSGVFPSRFVSLLLSLSSIDRLINRDKFISRARHHVIGRWVRDRS